MAARFRTYPAGLTPIERLRVLEIPRGLAQEGSSREGGPVLTGNVAAFRGRVP